MHQDIISSPLVLHPADNADDLTEQYNKTLSIILDKHAPILSKTVRVRPAVPWYGNEIREAKRERRRRERKWRNTKLPSDHTKFKDQRRTVTQMLITAKSRHFCDKIEECGRDSKLMFWTMYGLLGRGNISHMPKMDSTKKVVNSFSIFFDSEVQTIRDGLDRLAANQ